MNALARIVGIPVVLYRTFVSPFTVPSCRYAPTCSEYALEALAKHGAFRGAGLALRRILRCHPWGGHGYDPVPDASPPVADGADAEGPNLMSGVAGGRKR